MERQKICPIFTEESEFCEKNSSKPMSNFVPHQSYKISELVKRFESGKRLNVHMNFEPGSNFDRMSDEEAKERMKNEQIIESDFAPTDVHDVADVEAHFRAHEDHKKEFEDRQKKAKQAKQAAVKQAQQAQQENNIPPDPAK